MQVTSGVKGHLWGGDQTSHAHAHSTWTENKPHLWTVNKLEHGGKEGQRQTDRERKLSRWTTQIKECALFFLLFKEPEGGNSTFGIKACVSPIYCHGCLRQYISVLLDLGYCFCSALLLSPHQEDHLCLIYIHIYDKSYFMSPQMPDFAFNLYQMNQNQK